MSKTKTAKKAEKKSSSKKPAKPQTKPESVEAPEAEAPAQEAGVESVPAQVSLFSGLADTGLPEPTSDNVDLKDLPREKVDVDESMVASIRSIGRPFMPVVVLRDSKGKMKVRDGKRRVEASRQAGLERIPATIYDVNDLGDWRFGPAFITLVANQQRSRNPIAEAEAIHDMLKGGASLNDIARDTGMPMLLIRTTLSMMENLTDGALKQFKAGKIPTSAASILAKLPTETQEAVVKRITDGEKLGVKEIREIKKAKDAEEGTQEEVPEVTKTKKGALLAWYRDAEAALVGMDNDAPKGTPKAVEEALRTLLNLIQTNRAEIEAEDAA